MSLEHNDKIQWVPIHELTPHPKNPNKHSPEQIERLADILKYQGFRSPIVVSNRSGFIVAGHGRLLAALEIGLTKVPVSAQDFADDEQEYAHMVADNAIADWATLDLSMINTDVVELGPDFNIDHLGIKDFELDPADKYEDKDLDAMPDKVEPKAKLGQIYKLGEHRLMCGDSASKENVEDLMSGAKADMVFTDPPYGVSYQSNMRTKTEKFEVIKNDEVFLDKWIEILPSVSSGWVFVWTTWKVVKRWIEICEPIGDLSNIIIWDKGGGGIGDLKKTFSTDYEMALVYHRDANITGKRMGSVWSIGKESAAKYLHPTQKPVELCQTALLNCTSTNDIVLDLFGGSGSTLIACEKTKRKCYMMELDPHYVDVIIARWEKLTGKQAELISG